jgi:hypothetical protein
MFPSVSFRKPFGVVFLLVLYVDMFGVNPRDWKHTVDVWIARRREAVVGR